MGRRGKVFQRPNLTDSEKTLGSLLRGSYEALATEVYGRLGESGYPDIRRAHSAVLRTISPDGSRIVDLAAKAEMRKQSMGDLVNYLRDRGYVELKEDPSDGRAWLAVLTARGEKLQQRAMEISGEVEQEVAKRIGQAALTQLRETLEALAGMRQQGNEGSRDSGSLSHSIVASKGGRRRRSAVLP